MGAAWRAACPGTPPGKVDIPPLSVWRDEASDAEVVLTYETAYGTTATVFVLPNGVALCAAWAGDNTGPPPLADVQGFYATLKAAYPAAEVAASTFDAFFAVANWPEVKSKLPVVTEEIEDAWIYGVPRWVSKTAGCTQRCAWRPSTLIFAMIRVLNVLGGSFVCCLCVFGGFFCVGTSAGFLIYLF